VGLLLGLVIILPGAPTPKKQPYTTWSAFGGTSDSMQYSALSHINKSNVSQLQQVWFYPLPGRAELAFSPLIVGKVMYAAGKGNRSVVALDAATGQEIWTHPTEGTTTDRGYAYWERKDGKDQRIIFSANNLLQEVNPKTGLPSRPLVKTVMSIKEKDSIVIRRRSAGVKATARDMCSRT
jgi:quinoprotein glucose dehydrogenase